ncbi:YicC/YloC family endoribonuclease [Hirschia litorea]|uniref:YicC/YloC family endoribonuclease n=1 Tax=Hirschia litorea TaxID=1199156 RepID=A0ABW2IH41_9PROT
MTLMGMTGFGRAEGSADWGHWVWEIRSVNGKGLDVRLNTPSGLDALDFEAKKRIKSRFTRGNLQIQLQVEHERVETGPRIDTALLSRLSRQSRLQSQLNATLADNLSQLMSIKGVVASGSNRSANTFDDDMQKELLVSLDKALDNFQAARASEGQALLNVLNGILDELTENSIKAAEIAKEQPALVRDRFVARLQALKAEADEVTDERIAQEAAIFAAKADVKEELDRLDAHIAAGRQLLAGEGARGRKLDFLCQELNREANTLCSKSASLDLTNVGLALKTGIDQFKEQIQNVE